MPSKHEPKDRSVETERQLLRALCNRRTPRAQIISAVDRLADYAWLVPEHATVFHAIRGAISVADNSWPDLLPAQATRMGFPDVEWPEYFGTRGEEAVSIDRLLKQLID